MPSQVIPINQYSRITPHFVRIHNEKFLNLARECPAHTLQTLIYVGSFAGGQNRAIVITAAQLARDLNLSPRRGRDRLRELAATQFRGLALVTTMTTQAGRRSPIIWRFKLTDGAPMSCGGPHIREEFWIKHFDSGRRLAHDLSPEAHITLLTLACLADSHCEVAISIRALAGKLSVALSTVQLNVAELVRSHLIDKVSDRYVVSTEIGLGFRRTDLPPSNPIICTDLPPSNQADCTDLPPTNLASCTDLPPTNLASCTDLPPTLKRNRLKTTTRDVVVASLAVEATRVIPPPVSLGDERPLRGTRKADLKEGDEGASAELRPVAGLEKIFGWASALIEPGEASADLPWSTILGPKTTQRWLKRFGLERCLEVWNRAQTAKNPGGYMRKALEEGWTWAEVDRRQGPPEPSRPYLIDRAAKSARVAALAGLNAEEVEETGGPSSETLANLRLLVAGEVR